MPISLRIEKSEYMPVSLYKLWLAFLERIFSDAYRNLKSSDIIRDKLIQEGGFAIISLLNGDDCVVSMASYDSFISDRLGNQEMDFKIFDIIVDFLKSEGGIAKKGGSRSKGSVVGFGQCTLDTIIYQIAKYYYKKSVGESTFDPVFVLAAIMDWAGIASNERGLVRLLR